MEKKSAKSSGPPTTKERPPTSVAHQILEEFLSTLGQQEDYTEMSTRLRVAILENKPSEATLRRAIFGDEPL